jgi:hypothetical protein
MCKGAVSVAMSVSAGDLYLLLSLGVSQHGIIWKLPSREVCVVVLRDNW